MLLAEIVVVGLLDGGIFLLLCLVEQVGPLGVGGLAVLVSFVALFPLVYFFVFFVLVAFLRGGMVWW